MCTCMLNCFSHIRLFITLWTLACQAPLPMEFSRQEYWSWLPCPPPGDLPNPRTELRSPALYADSLPSEPPRKPNPKIYFTHNIHNLVRFNMYTLIYHNHNQGNKLTSLSQDIPFISFSSILTIHFPEFYVTEITQYLPSHVSLFPF